MNNAGRPNCTVKIVWSVLWSPSLLIQSGYLALSCGGLQDVYGACCSHGSQWTLQYVQLSWPVEITGSVSPATPSFTIVYGFVAACALSAHLQCDLAATGPETVSSAQSHLPFSHTRLLTHVLYLCGWLCPAQLSPLLKHCIPAPWQPVY